MFQSVRERFSTHSGLTGSPTQPANPHLARENFARIATTLRMPDASEAVESAVIFVASSDPTIPNRTVTGIITGRDSKQNQIILAAQEVAEGAAVTVQTKDLLHMGTALNSAPQSDSKWAICIQVV